MKINLINGPNLNLLGKREPDKYGNFTINEVINILGEKAKDNNYNFNHFQSNHEGEIIDYIHKECVDSDYIIINPGAFTHTSIAIRDALLAINAKVLEVHISNIHKREEFRHKSYISDIAIGSIIGLGINSYIFAFDYIINKNKEVNKNEN